MSKTDIATSITILDTSVIVADPNIFFRRVGETLIVPLIVIEELDGLKTRSGATGASARDALRNLEQIRIDAGGSLLTPVELENQSTLQVTPNGLALEALKEFHLDETVADHRILATALGEKERHPTANVAVLATDTAIRLKAQALGLNALEYTAHKGFDLKDYPGWVNIDVTTEVTDTLHKNGKIKLEDQKLTDVYEQLKQVDPTTFLLLTAPNSRALARRNTHDIELIQPGARNSTTWGLTPKNKEQKFAMNLLTDPNLPVVTISGKAGTGKTILAFAAALEQTMEAKPTYDRIMVLRPMYAIGKQELGFLPGDVTEKVAPWFDAITDSMVALSSVATTHAKVQEELAMWIERGTLDLQPVTFLRGRSLQKTFIIVDESQNLEVETIKTILTRVGEGSKVVLLGDPDQCDNPFTSTKNNGLSALVDGFKDLASFGHMTLTECERSPLAGLAADRL